MRNDHETAAELRRITNTQDNDAALAAVEQSRQRQPQGNRQPQGGQPQGGPTT